MTDTDRQEFDPDGVQDNDTGEDFDDEANDLGLAPEDRIDDDFDEPDFINKRQIRHDRLNRNLNNSIRRIDKNRPRHFFDR
jgi:hypothetical protein